MKHAFISSLSREHSVTRLCSALGVSRSGFYEWRDRKPSARARANERLLARIEAVHREAQESYGAVKTWKVLRRAGKTCGRHRVARLSRRRNGVSMHLIRNCILTPFLFSFFRGCRAAEEHNHLPPADHSITSSARSRIDGGNSIPNARAVLALIATCNRMDCTTGRSAGLAPLRMRPA